MKSLIQKTTEDPKPTTSSKPSKDLSRNHPEAFPEDKDDLVFDKLEKARNMKKLKKTVFLSFPKGYLFSSDDYKHIMHIFYKLQTHKDFSPLASLNTYELTAILFGCTKETVQKVIESEGECVDGRYNRWMKEKDIPLMYKDMFEEEIRAGLKRGVYLSSKYFKNILISDGIEVSKSTVIRKMKEWGLSWGSLRERDIRRKKKAVLEKREIYLAELIKNETEGFVNKIFYDESYIHRNHSLKEGWFIKEESKEIFKPSGAGERIAMMAALQNDGWAGTHVQHIKRCLAVEREDSFHYYKSIKYWPIKKDVENAGNVDQLVFLNYFETDLLPNLPPKSLIVIDNARYHQTYADNVFILKTSHKKGKIREYLESKGEKVEEHETKVDLIARAKTIYVKPKCQAELLAEAWGHRVLFLPPYHPELNAIEYAWAYVKKIAAEVAPYSISSLCNEVLPLAYSLVTPEAINKLYEHVKDEENRYRNSLLQEKAMIEAQSSNSKKEQDIDIENDSDEETDTDEENDDLEGF